MSIKNLIYKNQGNELLHAKFILDEADSVCEIDMTAALCMDNKKSD